MRERKGSGAKRREYLTKVFEIPLEQRLKNVALNDLYLALICLANKKEEIRAEEEELNQAADFHSANWS